MSDFNVRSDSINVVEIMEQIRSRIREKRGVDYTEEQIRELATVKLEKFLDPGGIRSDLLEEFRRVKPPYQPPELPNYAFEESTLFESNRGALRWLRGLLRPILKLFFNPNPLIQALHIQSQLNTMYADREAVREASRRATDQLYYELIHNLVLETTRLGIEVKNLKMRVESLSSRLDFDERRARALESVVAYEPAEEPARSTPVSQVQPAPAPAGIDRPRPSYVAPPGDAGTPAPAGPPSPSAGPSGEGPGQRSRRRRRRRGRRGSGGPAATMMPGRPEQAGAQTDSVDSAVAHTDSDASRSDNTPGELPADRQAGANAGDSGATSSEPSPPDDREP